MDRQTELRQQYRALHYMQSHGRKAENDCWSGGLSEKSCAKAL